MACLCGGRQKEALPIVDIEVYITDYAWRLASPTLTWQERLCSLRKICYMEVNWNCVEIRHRLTRFRKKHDWPGLGQREIYLFRTTFTNTTGKEQSYTFRTERSTTSSCEITVRKGFTIGGKLDLSFSLPVAAIPGKIDPLQVSGGLSGQFDWSKTRGERFEEKLTWSVDSQVKVEGNSQASAALAILEEDSTADFTVESTITGRDPQGTGTIPVYLRRKRDKEVLQIINVPCALAFKEKDMSDKPNFKSDPTKSPDKAKCYTEGVCNAVFGVEQIIKISSSLPYKEGSGQRGNNVGPGIGGEAGDGPVIEEVIEEEEVQSTEASQQLTAIGQ